MQRREYERERRGRERGGGEKEKEREKGRRRDECESESVREERNEVMGMSGREAPSYPRWPHGTSQRRSRADSVRKSGANTT